VIKNVGSNLAREEADVGLAARGVSVATFWGDTPDNTAAVKLPAIPAAATLDRDAQSARIGQQVREMKGAPRSTRPIIGVFRGDVLGLYEAIAVDDPDHLPEQPGHQARRHQPQTDHRQTLTLRFGRS
jgi:hypothetical protein